MGVTEVILLVIGILVFILSFLLPAGRKKETEGISRINEEQVKEIIDKQLDEAKAQISDIVDETITYSMEKTERSMERMTNEKIMAVNEYSNTVLEQINKNHQEAVFLYDMLNDKHESLKTAVSEAMKTASEVKQTARDAEITAMEAQSKVKEVEESLKASAEASEGKQPEADLKKRQKQPENLSKSGQPESLSKSEQPESLHEPAQKPEAAEPEFVPIQPKKVEILVPPAEKEEKAKKKTAGRSKTGGSSKKPAKVELSLASNEAGGRNNNERILELHEAGKSNMAIAKELGLGIGEVKLVIDLFEGI